VQQTFVLMHHRYEPGDVAVLYPENSPVDVETLLRRLGWEQDADETIYVMPSSPGMLPLNVDQI
jgi:sulfite reductase alpha subunit-like flavoprotein